MGKTLCFNISFLIIFLIFASGCVGKSEIPSDWWKGDNKTDDPQPKPTGTPTTAYVEISLPEIGASFVSTDSINLTASIHNSDQKIINWAISGYEIDSPTNSFPESYEITYLTGNGILFSPNPPAATEGRGQYLHYEINARMTDSGINHNDLIYIEQDEIDKCRQEYIDMDRNYEPTRTNFDDSDGSDHFTLAELSIASNYGENVVYIQPELTYGLEAVRSEVDCALIINSGYRNPMKQAEVSNAANGIHQYGAAVDIATPDFNDDGELEDTEWDVMKTAAHNAGACVEPSDYNGRKDVFIYIHMDWPTGQGGARNSCPINW